MLGRDEELVWVYGMDGREAERTSLNIVGAETCLGLGVVSSLLGDVVS